MIPEWAGKLIEAIIKAIAEALGESVSETKARVRMYLAGPIGDETDPVSRDIDAEILK